MLIFSDLDWVPAHPKMLQWLREPGHKVLSLSSLTGTSVPVIGPALLLTSGSDSVNLRRLRDNSFLQMILPIRSECLELDRENTIEFLEKSHGVSGSLILQEHQGLGENFSFKLRNSSERWALIEQVGDYARRSLTFENFSDIVRTVASELLTNAFYNAPQDEAGQFSQTDRKQLVQIKSRREIEFSYGACEKYLWMSVTDPFGTFTRDQLLDHLLKCASKEMLEVRKDKGGAGIGLYMVFSWASRIMFNFRPGHDTQVVVILLKCDRMKDFDSQRAIFEIIQL